MNHAGALPGSQVFDSNIPRVINYYGLSGGSTKYTAIYTISTVSPKDTPDNPSERYIDTLSGPSPVDTERFDPVDSFSGLGWGLAFDYYLTGTLAATGQAFTGGYFNFFSPMGLLTQQSRYCGSM
jgi:hypothetical protein